jgi:glycosyltransferase involved in cell wall biosynthesis
VLEAMACGLPVILSDILPHREIFKGTDYPYFFRFDDISGLSQLLSKILHDDRNKLSRQMRELIEQKYSAKQMSHKYQELYKSILR